MSRNGKTRVRADCLKAFRIAFLLVFLAGLILANSISVLPEGTDDGIAALEESRKELEEYAAKIQIQKEIKLLGTQIESLREQNEKLAERQQNLLIKIGDINATVAKLRQMNGDFVWQAMAVILFFSLGGFISSLLFVDVIWRVKVRGIRK